MRFDPEFLILQKMQGMSSLKKRLIEECKNMQLETIKNLKMVIDDAQKSANEYGMPKDRYDSFRTQLMRKRDMFSQQLLKANEQLDALNKIDLKLEMRAVEFGALVITDKQKLFISIGLGKFNFEEDDYYAISPLVPIFQAMEGKKQGESFNFRGADILIKEIY